MKSFKVELESIMQFAIALIQMVGLFLVKPEMFDLQGHNTSFLAGDPGIYVMTIISIAFILLSLVCNKPKHTRYWIWGTAISCIVFSIVFIKYNKDIGHKTFLATDAANVAPLRVIKGNNYRKEITDSCEIFKMKSAKIKELDVIQVCANIRDWNDIDMIWPLEEIKANTQTLLIDYYLCLLMGGISLIAGVQAIKCKRNDP